MTKLHEEFLRGTLSEVLAELRSRDSVYGEITLVFAAAVAPAREVSPEEMSSEFERLRASGMRRNDAVKAVAEKYGLRKNDVYRLLVE
jgi:16S rRNA (cytidine1402-2'-O)-methyltransferase